MELKQSSFCLTMRIWMLLIVPYGIETCLKSLNYRTHPLLIVPYGIETSLTARYQSFEDLLIVPYGIETYQNNDAVCKH